MLRKALTLYIGSNWRTFCGMSREDFVSQATAVLDTLEYEYSLDTIDTSGGEKLMLGAGEEADRISVDAPTSFMIDVVTARSTPLVAYALKFFSPKEMRDEMTADACVVDIDGIDNESRPAIGRLMTKLIEQSDRPPWKLTHHVGFRLAVLLRWKVKLLWKYWLSVRDASNVRPSEN